MSSTAASARSGIQRKDCRVGLRPKIPRQSGVYSIGGGKRLEDPNGSANVRH